jgi:hypothetical protein
MDIYNFNSKSKENIATPAMVMLPISEVLKMQKGYIKHLESRVDTIPSIDEIENIAHKVKKLSRDSSMKLADTIRDAIDSGDLTELAELEKRIRKHAFGNPEVGGL